MTAQHPPARRILPASRTKTRLDLRRSPARCSSVFAATLAALLLGWLPVADPGLGSGNRAAAQDLTGQQPEHGLAPYGARKWLRADATLRAVTFIDADRGWAVGDRGVILATQSGGDTWHRQHTPTLATLYDVTFVNARHGLAVGGYYSSDTQTSRGVILLTADGGRTWQRLDTDLPLLRSIRASADGSLVAGGDYSTVHMSAVFASDDGGKTWMGANAPDVRRCLKVVGSPEGSLSVLDASGSLHHLNSPLDGARAVLADALLADLVGDGPERLAVNALGTVYESHDGGRRWTRRVTAAPAAEDACWLAVTAVDRHCVVAGGPGNTIRSIDAGGKVDDVAAPVHAPLRCLHFFDAQRGWAVGAFGTILATRDGGQTWRVQRGGDHRAALLVVGQHTADVPWSVVAQEGLERGRRIAVAVVRSPSEADLDPLRPEPSSLLHQLACNLGGGETCWWQTETQTGRADARQIHAALQTYRPRVLVLSAQIDANHRRQWLQLASQAGVQRVLEPTAKGYSEWTLHGAALLPRTGALLSDLQRDAAALLQTSRPQVSDRYYRRTYDAMTPIGQAINDPLDGLLAASPAETRSIDTAPSRHALQILQARGGEEKMVARMMADGNRGGSYLQRFRLTLRQTPRENRLRLARHVLEQCRHSDQPDLYLQTLRVIVEQLDETPLGQWARLRSRAIENSDEWDLLQRATTHRGVPEPTPAQRVQLSPFAQEDRSQIRQASAVGDLVLTPDYSPQHAVAAIRPPAPRDGLDLAWDFDPRVVLQDLLRRGGSSNSAASLQPLRGQGNHGGQVKQLLTNPATRRWGELLAPDDTSSLAVPRVTERPYLDGRLDDACWAGAAVWTTTDGYQVRLAYDGQHLYVSATGTAPLAARTTTPDRSRHPDRSPVAADAQRSRDADLDHAARLVIKIDTDGDLLTAFGLEVDREGRTRDSCDGFTGWQPLWYVDTDQHEGRWTVEAAIRRSDLSPLPPVVGSHWKISVGLCDEGADPWQARLPDGPRWQAFRFE